MRGKTVATIEALILSSAMLVIQGCVIQSPSMRAVPVTDSIPRKCPTIMVRLT